MIQWRSKFLTVNPVFTFVRDVSASYDVSLANFLSLPSCCSELRGHSRELFQSETHFYDNSNSTLIGWSTANVLACSPESDTNLLMHLWAWKWSDPTTEAAVNQKMCFLNLSEITLSWCKWRLILKSCSSHFRPSLCCYLCAQALG